MILGVLLMMAAMEDNPDIELLKKAKDGDRDAFGELFKKYGKRVFRVARRMSSCDEDAWDITQDAFIRAMEAMDRFDTNYKFFTWIYRITANLAINYSRRKNRRREVHFEETYSAEGQQVTRAELSDRAAAEQLSDAVSRAVEKLTPALRAVFVLRVDQQLSYSEIAETLDIALGTVMSRLNRARNTIRAELGTMLEEFE